MNVDAFRERLFDLEVDPAAIAADPTGRAWLPSELQEAAASDRECAEALAEFVAFELDGFAELAPKDRTFVSRVAREAARRCPTARRVGPHRTYILLAAHALAAVVAMLVIFGGSWSWAGDGGASVSFDLDLGGGVERLRAGVHDSLGASREVFASLGWVTMVGAIWLFARTPLARRVGRDRTA